MLTTASTTKKIGAVGTPIHQVSNRIGIYEITVIAITIRPKDAEYLSSSAQRYMSFRYLACNGTLLWLHLWCSFWSCI